MPPETVTTRRLAAIVSVDVAGYSRLIAHDEVGTVRRLTEYRALIARHVESSGGRVVDNPGDNALLEFASPTNAVRCVLAIQDEVSGRNDGLDTEERMDLRVGVHLGEVLVEDDRIYGDGVNVAARLEALAPAGGVCVSKAVKDQVESKLSVRFEDMGVHELKNIKEPVRIYRVGSGPPAGAVDTSAVRASTTGEHRAMWIAVLPFDNIGSAPEQEYFADGITEDVITGLSAYRSLRVIARSSSFRYRGSDLPIPQIADELSVRYILEGSVRRAANRVRVSAQLIDTHGRHHVWADRYESDLDDIFDAQDQIARGIAVAIDPAIRLAGSDRSSGARPESLQAWDHVQRGWFNYFQFKPDRNRAARDEFTAAIDLDPGYAQAHAGLSWTHGLDVWLNWSDDEEQSQQAAYDEARTAITLDPRDAVSHVALAMVGYTMNRLAMVRDAADEARRLNPSLAAAYMMAAIGRVNGADPETGVQLLSQAMELSPRDPLTFFFYGARSIGHFILRDLESAMADARTAFDIRYGYLMGRAILTACLVESDRLDEAREQLATILDISPDFTVDRLNLYAFEDPADKTRMVTALSTAGLGD
jgi:adenylate cyclase